MERAQVPSKMHIGWRSLSSAAQHDRQPLDSRGFFKIDETQISTHIERRQNYVAQCSAVNDTNSIGRQQLNEHAPPN
jgi:hypothetical protein